MRPVDRCIHRWNLMHQWQYLAHSGVVGHAAHGFRVALGREAVRMLLLGGQVRGTIQLDILESVGNGRASRCGVICVCRCDRVYQSDMSNCTQADAFTHPRPMPHISIRQRPPGGCQLRPKRVAGPAVATIRPCT
eukprot:scaffold518_cov388-Prasinococcus_capsulatus_cf.AAC.14